MTNTAEPAHRLERALTGRTETYANDDAEAHSAGGSVRTRYTRVAVALHWTLAIAILGQILFGWFLEDVPRGTPERAFYVNLHKSIGVTLAPLLFFRLFWRWRYAPPPLPRAMPLWERVTATLSHNALYACMLLMPITGYVASNFSKWGVKYFNVVLLPPWGVDDKQIYAFFNGAHVTLSYVFVGLIGLHILGALRHLMRKDGLFERMWPARPP